MLRQTLVNKFNKQLQAPDTSDQHDRQSSIDKMGNSS